MKLTLPDYEKSIVGIPNSIMNYFYIEPKGKTLPMLDQALEKTAYKNVVVFCIDGLGVNVLKGNLDKNGLLRGHLAGTISSVFPPTTVAATTSLQSGLMPCSHSWLGWECYYPQVDKIIVVFRNTQQGTGTPAAEYHIANTYTGYRSVQSRFEQAGKQAYVVSPFEYPYPDSLEKVCNSIEALCLEEGQKYIYAYSPEPDRTLHQYGCFGDESKEVLKQIENRLEILCKNLWDTLVVITADHGFIDCRGVCIKDYPVIMESLVRMPTIEPRALNLFVKEEKKQLFEEEFNRQFDNDFVLLTKEEILEKQLFGTGKEHDCFRDMLGDYLAVATGDLAIFNTHEDVARFNAGHAGLTKQELDVPLILFDLREDLKRFSAKFWGDDGKEPAIIPLDD